MGMRTRVLRIYSCGDSRANQMDDCATLDVIDGQYNEASDSEEEQGEMWGRCFPIGRGFDPQGDFSKYLSRDQIIKFLI